MGNQSSIISKFYTIRGLIQGIGFRPFVYRIAHKHSLSGWVKNSNEAVYIHIEGTQLSIDSFEKDLSTLNPDASKILSINSETTNIKGFHNFSIEPSDDVSNAVTHISPDLAVCPDCVYDMHRQSSRINYPLINCCHCGPRFTIIKSLPYDRGNTTMNVFPMCPTCRKEYENPLDRRFHAQPVACNECGPKYSLFVDNGSQPITRLDDIIQSLASGLKKGHIYAFKATGGYNLVCNATNESAVSKLRSIKLRDSKPFAVMFKNIETAKRYLFINEAEESELLSYRRPIVICQSKMQLAASVSKGLNTIGAMLPYMPFHYLLFQISNLDALVMTSGNLSDEPILIDDEKALKGFIDQTDGVLTYNREIYNRTDDSVVMVANNKPRIIRRSRGYVPQPIGLHIDTEGILATGAELTGTFCIGKGKEAIASQYLGDLQNYENFNFYAESFDRFKQLFRFEPRMLVADMHPDYASSTFAKQFAIQPLLIQHHHAHIASVIAEHQIKEPMLGIAFDGTGYGTDGNIWGSEFLLCSNAEFERIAHFEYVPLPGGDKVILEPWRSALAYMYSYYGKDVLKLNIPFIKNLNNKKATLIMEAIDKKINSPLSCSAGRLFDAVAAITGICTQPTFHAEAPMRLEACIDMKVDEKYDAAINKNIISFKPVIKAIIDDLVNNIPVGAISAKFHNTIIDCILQIAIKTRNEKNINIIALSGGTFQNKYLLEKTENLLQQNLFKVYSNLQAPANDGGIALGQLYLAALKRTENIKR